ncbi:MAG TPA: erythromycin esterase family protein [Terriglobales bacterium]|nr:erythromycin esterase family protein [Terriglobales bacterium]
MKLERGDTALLVVRQVGVDVVVDVIAPSGNVVGSFDSPTGRNGDEIIEFEASDSADYTIRVRPFDEKEPSGQYRLEFSSVRNAEQTAKVIEQAQEWLLENSRSIPVSGIIPESSSLPTLEGLLRETRVLGIGEATHGSREFGDFRLSLTRRLIERNGYRIVAIEGSESRFRYLAPYVSGEVPKSDEITKRIEVGWIGRRSQADLVEWVRSWNIKHPMDQVQIVGIDAQDNEDSREILGRLIEKAYGENAVKRWKEVAAELNAADEQTQVFGDSGVNSAARQFLLEVKAMLDVDGPLLRARFGTEFEAAQQATETLVEFADFNSSGDDGTIHHSRDWYMANRILRALQEAGPESRAVYWAHNAHVVHPSGSTATAGGLLRDVLGCGYSAIAVTFGQGGFVAQIPNDAEDRLAVSTLPPAPKGAIEALFSRRPEAALAAWGCQPQQLPEWFAIPRRMHWVGGLFKPGTDAAEAFRPFMLASDFDGVAYLPTVTPDPIPGDRPLIPARKR